MIGDSMNQDDYLLTLAIPTYNRGIILDKALEIIQPQLENAKFPIEFIVSDNASDDNTSEIIRKYISLGMPIQYNRNQENIGAAANIVKCYNMAKGKYIWVLGDDDYLVDDALTFILSILNSKDYGFIHFGFAVKSDREVEEYTDGKRFISKISYWITWISCNIAKKKYVEMFNPANEKGVWKLLPSQFNAIIESGYNIYIHRKMFSNIGINFKTAGGYNFFEYFVYRYLSEWRENAAKVGIGWFLYEKEKYVIFRKYLCMSIYSILLIKSVHNFNAERAWHYIIKYYWYYPYFYLGLFALLVRYVLRSFFKMGKFIFFKVFMGKL
ncbi:hypothetical protein FACS189483_01930 [Spirochaetia bacterium]|nr:hypothetical protein FACS189483_01930 [Spirochaetia bacterium]